jgi:holo-[acyl-carrier protein] synthase
MILGIGIDTIEIDRFSSWHTYSEKKLQRIFSPEEIIYCMHNVQKSAERFAVRFAAREALYKAISYAYPDITIPFLTLCAHTTIQKVGSRPVLTLRNVCGIEMSTLIIHLSLTHSRAHATAFVMLESR